jgi:biopolymer transport protein ExbD
LSELTVKLHAIAAAGYDGTIFLSADKSVDHGPLKRAISEIRKGGVSKVVLMTASAPQTAEKPRGGLA